MKLMESLNAMEETKRAILMADELRDEGEFDIWIEFHTDFSYKIKTDLQDISEDEQCRLDVLEKKLGEINARETYILEYKNDWEADVYSVNGRRISNLKKVTIDGQEYDVTSKTVSVPYSDHGHGYTARSKHYFIDLPIVGKFDLREIVNRNDIIVKQGDYNW